MNYYEILKEHVQVLHKTQPEYFQIAHDKLSVMNFPLVEIGKHFPMRFVLCKDIEMFSIKNNTWKNYKPKKKNFYFWYE